MATTLSRALHATAVIGLLLQSGSVTGVQSDDRRGHVRSSDALITDLVRDGQERSPTFRELTALIDRSDGIVYIEPGTCPLAATRGCLIHWIGRAGQLRMLRVYVRLERVDRDQLIAVVAHELQHVNEVLVHSTVRTSAEVRSLFQRLGSDNDPRSGETRQALRVGELVAEELRHNRRELAAGVR